jgi:GNAT superfamily N-acetyltransferase
MAATIIRFPNRKDARPKSGRFSARMVYAAEGTPDASAAAARIKIERERAGDSMGCDYSLRLGPGAIARIRLEQRGPGHWWIDWVFVPPSHRGKGLARLLMGRVLADADAAAVTLSLEPKACAGVEQTALERWYEGLGFSPTGRRGELAQIFRRRPKSTGVWRRAA